MKMSKVLIWCRSCSVLSQTDFLLNDAYLLNILNYMLACIHIELNLLRRFPASWLSALPRNRICIVRDNFPRSIRATKKLKKCTDCGKCLNLSAFKVNSKIALNRRQRRVQKWRCAGRCLWRLQTLELTEFED